jgi:hypothetical protein
MTQKRKKKPTKKRLPKQRPKRRKPQQRRPLQRKEAALVVVAQMEMRMGKIEEKDSPTPALACLCRSSTRSCGAGAPWKAAKNTVRCVCAYIFTQDRGSELMHARGATL